MWPFPLGAGAEHQLRKRIAQPGMPSILEMPDELPQLLPISSPGTGLIEVRRMVAAAQTKAEAESHQTGQQIATRDAEPSLQGAKFGLTTSTQRNGPFLQTKQPHSTQDWGKIRAAPKAQRIEKGFTFL